jgi:hypothetical protein
MTQKWQERDSSFWIRFGSVSGNIFQYGERLTKHEEPTFLACEVLRVTCTAKTFATINTKGTFA